MLQSLKRLSCDCQGVALVVHILLLKLMVACQEKLCFFEDTVRMLETLWNLICMVWMSFPVYSTYDDY